MKRFATITAIAALLGTGALANDNEIFVNQSGSDNFIGDADNPVEQVGTSNLMTFTQSGNGNAIGTRAPYESPLPTWPMAEQIGANHDMEVIQSGHRNSVELLRQKGGDQNQIFVRQGGNDNRIVNLHQHGNKNMFDVRQGGNDNFGNSLQVGDHNITEVRQGGHRNEYDLSQGEFAQNGGSDCTSCDILLNQGGNDNYANVYQQDHNQLANIRQGGNGNTVYTYQSN